MTVIPPPDSHYLSAAQGWVELGRYGEAQEELSKIGARLQNHPDVLQVKWLIRAHDKEWEACLEIARQIVRRAPEMALGWINQANALFYMKRIEEAYDLLLPTAGRFPGNFIIPYNLACYLCQLGKRHEAWEWFMTAVRTGDSSAVKSAALRDPDLEPMWKEIQKI